MLVHLTQTLTNSGIEDWQPKDELADIKISNSDRDLDNAISSC
jgi:hypothetical protein